MTLIIADLALLGPAIWLRFDWITAALFAGLIILAFDIRGRRGDFRQAYKHLARGRNPARVAKAYQFSWCGRVACEQAAWAAGQAKGRAVSAYFHANGYRWFHVFPDNTFTLKCPFLTLRFWEITLWGNNRARQKLEELAVEEADLALLPRPEISAEPMPANGVRNAA